MRRLLAPHTPASALELAARLQEWFFWRFRVGRQRRRMGRNVAEKWAKFEGGGRGVEGGGDRRAEAPPRASFGAGAGASGGARSRPAPAPAPATDAAAALAGDIMRSFLTARVLAAPYTEGFHGALTGIVERLAELLRRRAVLRAYGAGPAAAAATAAAAASPRRPLAAELLYEGAVPALWRAPLVPPDAFAWLDAPIPRGNASDAAIEGFLLSPAGAASFWKR